MSPACQPLCESCDRADCSEWANLSADLNGDNGIIATAALRRVTGGGGGTDSLIRHAHPTHATFAQRLSLSIGDATQTSHARAPNPPVSRKCKTLNFAASHLPGLELGGEPVLRCAREWWRVTPCVSRASRGRYSPTMMPHALTSPISFLSATPPPPPDSCPASVASLEPAVLLRCLAPSVILLFEPDLSPLCLKIKKKRSKSRRLSFVSDLIVTSSPTLTLGPLVARLSPAAPAPAPATRSDRNVHAFI